MISLFSRVEKQSYVLLAAFTTFLLLSKITKTLDIITGIQLCGDIIHWFALMLRLQHWPHFVPALEQRDDVLEQSVCNDSGTNKKVTSLHLKVDHPPFCMSPTSCHIFTL